MKLRDQVRRLSGETVIYGIPQVASRLVATFLVPLYTRVFTAPEYGVLGIMTSITQLASTFVVLGLDTASARWFYDSDDPAHRRSVMSSWAWCQLSVGIMAASLVSFGAPGLARLFPRIGIDVRILALAIWVVPLSAFGRVLANLFRYQRRPWANVWFSVATSLFTVGFIVLFVVVWKRGLAGLYVGQIVANAMMTLAAFLFLVSWISPARFSWRLLKQMLAFGLPLIPAALASWATSASDRLLLSFLAGPEESGIYYVGVQLAGAISLVTIAFQQAWGPFAFSIAGEKNASQIYAKVFTLFCFTGSLLAVALSIFALPLLRLFATPAYFGAYTSLPFLTFGYLALSSTYIGVLGSSLEKKSGPIAVSIFIGAVVDVGLNMVLIRFLGRDGAGISMLVAYAVSAVYIFRRSQRLHPIPYRFRDALICLLGAAVLITIDRIFLNADATQAVSVGVLFAKTALACAFLLLAFPLGIARSILRRGGHGTT